VQHAGRRRSIAGGRFVLDVRQLSNFLKVVELKSLSRAADQLGIGQPALGMQICALEDELKQPLVTRHSRGIEPTEAGLVLLKHAEPILAAIDAARRAVTELNEPKGRVSIGMIPPANALLLASLVQRVVSELPKVKLNIVEDLTNGLISRLQSGDIDLACVYAHAPIKGVVIESLVGDFLCFVTGDESFRGRDTISFREVLHHPLILPAETIFIRQRLDLVARERGASLDPILEVKSEALIKDLVEQRVGHTILPFNSVARAVRNGALFAVRIVEPNLPSTMCLARCESRPPRRASDAVAQLIRQIGQTFAALPGRTTATDTIVRVA
jgi:LysR family nitrogen assimilation transcriptional regulator